MKSTEWDTVKSENVSTGNDQVPGIIDESGYDKGESDWSLAVQKFTFRLFCLQFVVGKRAGIKEIILSAENRKDVEEIKAVYVSGLTIHYVDDIKQVIDMALLNEKVKDPIVFDRKHEESV